ncbi:MAG: gliding motility protein GldN [Flavobacteriales bacterium]|nr:gliding motility protein GldN [Flavobacteriales bacterium]
MDRLRTTLLLLAGLPCAALDAQNVLDGAYIREHAPTKRAVPQAHLREADVMWHQRYWRTIDLRQKMNQPLYYPLTPTNGVSSLWDVIRKAVYEDGSVTAYDPGPLLQDDGFTRAMTTEELAAVLEPVDTVWTPSLEDPEVNIPVPTPKPLESGHIRMYRLKEDWFFDRQRGVMDVRIIGIAPLREVRGEDGELRGYAPVFWLYYPELRYVLANAMAINPRNEGARLTYDDILTKRLFASTVTAESNVHGRSLADHLTGVDALLEAERIKQGLFQREHDLWNP